MSNKYNAKSITIDGQRFDSQGEYRRHQELELLQKAGVISDLRRQPIIELIPAFFDRNGKKQRAITYRADWAYTENEQTIIEDFKGFETKVFKLKKKLFMYKYPNIELRITK